MKLTTFCPRSLPSLFTQCRSTNICGEKLWRIYQRDEVLHNALIFIIHHQTRSLEPTFPSDVTSLQGADSDIFEDIVQEAGETMFVPSMWPHTVLNRLPTLSINHNWGMVTQY